MEQNSDFQLVTAAQRGCVQSFGVLYERYFRAVAAIGYAVLGHREAAEDLAQEVFVIACRDLDRLKRPDRFGAWVAGICRNQARRVLRAAGRTAIQPLSFDVEARAGRSEHELDVLRAALAGLKPAERELIALRYHDNLPYERIGAVLNCSTRAVNGRLIRARDKIARYLKRHGLMGDEDET